MKLTGFQVQMFKGVIDSGFVELGIPYGGKVPKGRLSEDGGVPMKYDLIELDSERGRPQGVQMPRYPCSIRQFPQIRAPGFVR